MVILYGLSKYLEEQLGRYLVPVGDVEAVIDNGIAKTRFHPDTVDVISWEEYVARHAEYQSKEIVICTWGYYGEIRRQILSSELFSSERILYIDQWIQQYSLKKSYLEWLFVERKEWEELQREQSAMKQTADLAIGEVTNGQYDPRIISRCCCEEDFFQPWFAKWKQEIVWCAPGSVFHRKEWEFVYCLEALDRYGCLKPGMRGLGFAVGQEPLPSFFAGRGIHVMATDLSFQDAAADGWAKTNQHAGKGGENLWKEDLCSHEEFLAHCTYRDVDMNDLPEDLVGYDFCWSCCAIEHVGSLEKSKQFLRNMVRVLKPGGVAVHTTEFNLSSDEETVEEGGAVIFRRRDIEEIKEWMERNGCEMETSYGRSNREGDRLVVFPASVGYRIGTDGRRYHLVLQESKYAATSFAIIVRKKDGCREAAARDADG